MFRAVCIIGALTILAAPAVVQADAVVEYKLTYTYEELGREISTTDLISGMTIGNGAFFEGGWIDPDNGVNAFHFNYLDCLEQWDGVEAVHPITGEAMPLDCFHHGYGADCAPEVKMPLLTDGLKNEAVDGTNEAVVLRDFGRACLVARYDFDEPTDIGEIQVFTRNLDVRIFQNYDVYVSYDENQTTGLEPLAEQVVNGIFGYSTNPVTDRKEWSYTHVYDCTGQPLATGVRKLRFVFWPVGLGDLMMDPWRGYWHPSQDGSFWSTVCPDLYPAEPGDVDGRMKPFNGPIVPEIDVLPPQSFTPGDADGDGLATIADFAVMEENFEGPDGGADALPIAYAAIPFDFDPKDCDVDLADFATFQIMYNPIVE